MKRMVMFFAAVMFLLGVSGQAMAYFAQGDLIQIVYQSGGSYEVGTDLGAFAPTSPYGNVTGGKSTDQTINFSANPFSLPGQTGAFSTASWSNLNVAYFVTNGTSAWTSGPDGGQTMSAGAMSAFQAAAQAILQQYAAFGTGQGQLLQSNINSYFSRMHNAYTQTGTGGGGAFGFLSSNGETNLAALGNGAGSYVDSYLYYYADSSTLKGLQVADIRTFADGTSEVVGGSSTAANGGPLPVTPVPPSVLLMGSGLLGLAGIRKKQTI
jgi:hypothetical protein